MKKTFVVSIIVLFLLACIYPSSAVDTIKEYIIPLNNGNTLYVGGSGPGNYTNIQDAIDNASDWDTVFVYSGIYFENVLITVNISLIVENRDTTIIDANYTKSAVSFRCEGGRVSGFTLQHGANKSSHGGIQLGRFNGYFKYHVVDGNKIVDNLYGIYGFGSDECIISNNIIMNNRESGIYLLSEDKNQIYGNIVVDNEVDGILVGCSDDNKIFNNYIENSSFGMQIYECGYHEVFENYVTNCSYYGICYESLTWYGGSGKGDWGRIYSNILKKNNIGVFVLGNAITIEKNNFFENNKSGFFVVVDDYFPRIIYHLSRRLNNWKNNYYDDLEGLFRPKIIWGEVGWVIFYYFYIPLNSIDIDFNPAREPFDI